jgi:hypothetical protein
VAGVNSDRSAHEFAAPESLQRILDVAMMFIKHWNLHVGCNP